VRAQFAEGNGWQRIGIRFRIVRRAKTKPCDELCADASVASRDHVLQWGKDVRRAVDYLSTRMDLDSTRLAFSGASWGGAMGGLMLAIEPRFRVAILYIAGLEMTRMRPEVDVFNFLSRVRTPAGPVPGPVTR